VITVLVVGDRDRARELDLAAQPNASLELLHASGLEDALDRIARNRRIDAVLLLMETDQAEEATRTLREEDPAGPPIFVPAPTTAEGTQSVPASSPKELLDTIARELRADS
jgi:vacuolar-type H+-ATPase subunit F/Vma7